MKVSQDLIAYVEQLLAQANNVRLTSNHVNGMGSMVNAGKLNGLVAGCRLLVEKLGPYGKVWDSMLQPLTVSRLSELEKISGVLEAIADALVKGRLSTIDELVSAEVLGDLLEHADALIASKYNLAAAVILRAVLEERLRKLCESNNCLPSGQRPTIENFKVSLQLAKVIDKVVVKDIDWMAGIGNAAAHRLTEYRDEDVPQLYQRIVAFLIRYSPT